MLGHYFFNVDIYCLAEMIYNIVCAKHSPRGPIKDIQGLPKILNGILKQ